MQRMVDARKDQSTNHMNEVEREQYGKRKAQVTIEQLQSEALVEDCVSKNIRRPNT